MNFTKLHKLNSVDAIHSQIKANKSDIIIIAILALVAGLALYGITQRIYPLITNYPTMDVWFHTDAPRVFNDMTKYSVPHDRTSVHPLFVILIFPIVSFVKTVFFLTPTTAVEIVLAGVASLWVSLLFITFRLIGCRQLDATLFSILGAISAAAMFWLAIPDVYPFGGLTILLGLTFVALAEHRKLSMFWYVVVSAMTLSITVTNWMLGIHWTITNQPWKKAIQITLAAWVLVVLLVLVQKGIFPTTNAGFIKLNSTIQGEEKYIQVKDFPGSLRVIKSFFCHTIVMPSVKLFNDPNLNLERFSVQMSSPGSGSILGSLATFLWIALLCLGLWGLFTIRKHLRLRVALGLTILGQLALHLVYGTDETFLYTLHFAPLLLLLAALSTLTPARSLALVLTGMLIVSAGINNTLQLNRAIDLFTTHEFTGKQAQSMPWLHDTTHPPTEFTQ
jgi:hypothetical protein